MFFLRAVLLSTFCLGGIFVPELAISSDSFSCLTRKEERVLSTFLHTLFKDSEAGYVFFNEKPVCIHGYREKDNFKLGVSSHREMVALREGSRIWQQLSLPYGDSELYIHICKREDPTLPDYRHVLFINLPLFQKVVKENIALFQYVLGPSVTAQSLTNALVVEDQPFHSLLKNDKVLIGLLLGFGEQNSLYVSRLENLQESFGERVPPFLEGGPCLSESCQDSFSVQPSFGYRSVKEESVDLQKRIALSSEKLAQKKPEYIFGWLKNSETEKARVLELELVQDRIIQWLASPDFLEATLRRVTGKDFLFQRAAEHELEKSETNEVVARGLWEVLCDYDLSYVSSFIEGLTVAIPQNAAVPRLAWFPRYRQDVLEARENLKEANRYFQSLDRDKQLNCVIPQKLYYKKIAGGQEGVGLNSPFVNLDYSIFSPLGHCLSAQSKAFVNLENTISGFSQGVRGMHIGETRELYIHPSLAYGNSEKCVYLRVIVTCRDVYKNETPLSLGDCLELDFLLDPTFERKVTKNYQAALKEKGAQIGQFLKKHSQVDLSKIAVYLKNFKDGKDGFTPTTEKEQELINRIHWDVYFDGE